MLSRSCGHGCAADVCWSAAAYRREKLPSGDHRDDLPWRRGRAEPADGGGRGGCERGSAGGRSPRFEKQIYKDRNTVERGISRLRGYRAVATRYDKREVVYKGTIDVASIVIWLRDPTEADPRDTP
jgi:transposase